MTKTFTILCCTDFSEKAREAFRHAGAIAAGHPGASIHLLNVLRDVDAQFWNSYLAQSEQDNAALAHADIARRIDAEYRPLLPEGVTLIPELRSGQPAEQTLALADELKADLLVIAKQNKGAGIALKKFFFEDVSLAIASQAKCPVLLIP